MSKQFKKRLQHAQEGNRDSAHELWKEALLANDSEYFVEATILLAYQDKVKEAWLASWNDGDTTTFKWLSELLGFDLPLKKMKAIEKALQTANGQRRKARIEVSQLLSQLYQSRQREDEILFQSSYATTSGATTFVAGYIKGQLRISIKSSNARIQILKEGDEGYDEWAEEWELTRTFPPNISTAFGDHFEGWDDWSATQRQDAFASWCEDNKTIDIDLLPLRLTADEDKEIITPAGDILPQEQNERLARCLQLIEGANSGSDPADEGLSMAVAWQSLCEEWLHWPKDTMDEIELSLLDRALYNWPDNVRYFRLTAYDETLNYRPLQRLCRTFSVADFDQDNPIGPVLAQGILREATTLYVSVQSEDAMKSILAQENSPRVKVLSINFGAWMTPSLCHWIGQSKVWSQLTSLDLSQESDEDDHGVLAAILATATSLESLQLNEVSICEKAARAIASMDELKTLELVYSNINDNGAAVWKDAFPPALETLSYQGICDVNGILGESCQEPKIKHLRIQQSTHTIGNRGMLKDIDAFLSSPIFSQLESFQSRESGPQSLGLTALVKHGIASTLRSLTIGNSELPQKDVEMLQRGEAFDSVESLAIHASGCGDTLIEQLTNGTPFPSLRECEILVDIRENGCLGPWLNTLPASLVNLTLPQMEKVDQATGKAIAAWEGLAKLEALTFRVRGTFYKRAKTAIESSDYFPHNAHIEWGS